MIDFTKVPKFFAGVALAALVFTASPASAATVYGIQIQAQGYVECETLERYKPSETGGNVGTLSGCRVTDATRYVSARIGQLYGCIYDILGAPNGTTVPIEYRFVIPSPGVVNPSTGEHFLVRTTYWNKSIGSTGNMIGWSPDHAGELVAGDWTMEVRYDGRLLGSCTFHVST